MALKESRSVENSFLSGFPSFFINRSPLLTYSDLVGDILLDIHGHPLAEHCCRAEAGGSCEDKLVVDESPSTLTTLYGDQCHPGHRLLCLTSSNNFAVFPFLVFYRKFLLALVTLLHSQNPMGFYTWYNCYTHWRLGLGPFLDYRRKSLNKYIGVYCIVNISI